MLTLLLSRYARSAAKIHPTPASASWNLRTLSLLTNLSAKQSGTLQELLFPYHSISVPQSSKLVCSPLGKCIGVITGVMLTHITSFGVHIFSWILCQSKYLFFSATVVVFECWSWPRSWYFMVKNTTTLYNRCFLSLIWFSFERTYSELLS